jgi:hypothetical protein
MSNATELLRRALDFLDFVDITNLDEAKTEILAADLRREIRTFLDAEPEVEPRAWLMTRDDLESVALEFSKEQVETYWTNIDFKIEPLYTRPEPEAEPVAWTNQDELNTLGTDVTCYMYSEPMAGENNIPLYTISKPTRKPMTEEEIADEFGTLIRILRNGTYFIEGVFAGVRFAEKHHGISQRCENS